MAGLEIIISLLVAMLIFFLLGVFLWGRARERKAVQESANELQKWQNATCCDLPEIKKSDEDHLTFKKKPNISGS